MKLTDTQIQASQLLSSPAKHILLRGGSRSGKTFLLCLVIFIRALKCKSRHLVIRYRFNHAKTSLWYDTFKKVHELAMPGLPLIENKTDWFLQFPNGSQIWIGGLDDKERTEKVLGHEYSTIYYNEISQMSYDSITTAHTRLAEKTKLINKEYYDCNPPEITHWSYSLFMKGIEPIDKEPVKKELYATMQMNPGGNIDNLPDGYIEDVLERLPARQRKRFLLGEYTEEVTGAMWTILLIEKNRVALYPELKRVVIAVDPAVTSKKDSDETGIVVCGLGVDNFGYVLEDISGTYTPNGWARKAVMMYYKWKADRVIGEVNNGGDMIENTLRGIDTDVSYRSVHATRGKVTRAEPVVAMYEQGKIKHVGVHSGLETQMTTWKANQGDQSPDRVDALVWGLTELKLYDNSEFFFV